MQPLDKDPLARRLGRWYGTLPLIGKAILGTIGVFAALFLANRVASNLDMSGVRSGLVLFGVALLYFAPAVIASRRDVPNKNSVFVVNLFFGWTVVGWVVALAWAVSGTPSKPIQAPPRASMPSDIKQCPFCAEDIKKAAIVCKHCGRDLPSGQS